MPFNRGRAGETNWKAQDREVSVGDGRDLGAVDLKQLGVKDSVSQRIRSSGGINLQWRPGPPTSHIHSFALWDARLLLTMRDPSGAWVVDSPGDLPPSRLYVRFRPSPAGFHRTKRKGIRSHKARNITQYVYYTEKHSALKTIYERMAMSPHPGIIVHDKLQEEVPYQRIY
jgi:hypothetical protein